MERSEADFHASRTMWYFDGTGVVEAPQGDTRSHKEWLGDSWDSVVRGFYKDRTLMIYQGANFAEPACSQGVINTIMEHFGVGVCGLGVVVGEVGQLWMPRRIALRVDLKTTYHIIGDE